MTSELQLYDRNTVGFDVNVIEQLILRLGDAFDIRIVWDRDTAVLTGALALAGGLIGGYHGGRLGAALGAGFGGAAGLGLSSIMTLREIWSTIRDQLQELLYIVFNFLRRLDPIDYINAVELLMTCYGSRRELVLTILDFIAHKIGREVLSTLASA